MIVFRYNIYNIIYYFMAVNRIILYCLLLLRNSSSSTVNYWGRFDSYFVVMDTTHQILYGIELCRIDLWPFSSFSHGINNNNIRRTHIVYIILLKYTLSSYSLYRPTHEIFSHRVTERVTIYNIILFRNDLIVVVVVV